MLPAPATTNRACKAMTPPSSDPPAAPERRSGVASGEEERAGPLGLFSWALYDWAHSAFPTVILTFVFAAYFTRQIAPDEAQGTALWGNTIGIAGVLVALAAPVLGAIADHAGRPKRWIAVFTLLTVIPTALLWQAQPEGASIALVLLLVGVGTIASELSFVFYNAMLPRLAGGDRIGRWSGWGWGLGYAGGLLCLGVSLLWLLGIARPSGLDTEAAEHVRATFVLAAAWLLVFSLPLLAFTPDAPGRDAPGHAVRTGLAQLRETLRALPRYRPVLWFLVARMLYIDGLGTLFVFGGVYAAGTFDMDERGVLAFGIALNAAAGLGAVALAWLDDRIGSRPTILLSLVGLTVPGAAMLLVASETAFWVLGMLLGLFVGPVQASSRSLMARLAPAQLRNELFGLYAFSGKATAFLGPLLVGWVTAWSGSQRAGMAVIIVLFVAGFVLLALAPRDERERAARAAAPSSS